MIHFLACKSQPFCWGIMSKVSPKQKNEKKQLSLKFTVLLDVLMLRFSCWGDIPHLGRIPRVETAKYVSHFASRIQGWSPTNL